jgi:hypothetical protein
MFDPLAEVTTNGIDEVIFCEVRLREPEVAGRKFG